MCYYPKYLYITLCTNVTEDWLRKDTVFIEMKYDVMCLFKKSYLLLGVVLTKTLQSQRTDLISSRSC